MMMSRIGTNRSFTLIEVMIASCVLALGAILIHEAFFTAMNTFNYGEHYLDVAYFADEKLWQARDSLMRLGYLEGLQTSGAWVRAHEHYHWELSSRLQDQAGPDKLFQVAVRLFWQEDRRKAEINRSTFVLYKKEE